MSIQTLPEKKTDESIVLEELMKEKEKEQHLLTELMSKNAERQLLKKENKRLEKESRKIIESKAWKLIRYFDKLSSIRSSFSKFSGKSKRIEQHEEVIRENADLKKRVDVLNSEINKLNRIKEFHTDLQGVNSGHLEHTLKHAKEEGQFLEYLDSLMERKRIDEHKYNSALRYAARLFKNEKIDLKHLVYSRVLSALSLEETPEFLFRTGEGEHSLSFQEVASFKASLAMQARKRQLVKEIPEWVLDNKKVAYAFIDNFGIRRPWIDEKVYTCSQLPKWDGMVIKPIEGSGSRGVYLVFSSSQIQDVKRGRILNSREALTVSMINDLELGWVEKDEWMIEELIHDKLSTDKLPASDLKFYCFYGKVALILEIRRFPELKYCWWKPDGTRISTGKYEDDLFSGQGFMETEKELAAYISSEIPAPFIRIDFLKTANGMVFGEFTPKPGNYDEFNAKYDQLLGDSFLDAEARLSKDLVNKKEFEHYKSLITDKTV
jgi:hypothetical protein